MPIWLPVGVAFLAVLGTLGALAYRLYEIGHSEQKELRETGAEIVSWIEEVVHAFKPVKFEPTTETSAETWQSGLGKDNGSGPMRTHTPIFGSGS